LQQRPKKATSNQLKIKNDLASVPL